MFPKISIKLCMKQHKWVKLKYFMSWLLLGGVWYWCWCGMSQAIWCVYCRFHFISTKHPNISPSSKRGSKHDRHKSSLTFTWLWSRQGSFQHHATHLSNRLHGDVWFAPVCLFFCRDEYFVYYSVCYVNSLCPSFHPAVSKEALIL